MARISKHSKTPIIEYEATNYRLREVVGKATVRGNCSPFIDFMLGEILNSLQQAVAAPTILPALSDTERFIMELLRKQPKASAKVIAEERGISLRQVEKLFNELKKKGIILRMGARRNGEWKVLIPTIKA